MTTPVLKYAPMPAAPETLSAAAASIWDQTVHDFVLHAHELVCLKVALEAWTRMDEAREVLNREGVTYIDRFGAPRSRPEVAIERDNRIAFLRAWRELGLPTEEPTPKYTSLAPR